MRILALVAFVIGCTPPGPSLIVEKRGDGDGVVTSEPAGIACGDQCGAVVSGTVTLTAAPDAVSEFVGWNGGGCAGTEPCSPVLAEITTVTALFAHTQHELVTTTTPGGRITSLPYGIDCGATCSATFWHGTKLHLEAKADPGFRFLGWDAPECASATTCVLDVVEPRSIAATFALDVPLTVTSIGTGSVDSWVFSTPSGLTAAIHQAVFPFGTLVTLSAQPRRYTLFQEWGGDCAGTSPTCTVTMDRARNVTARFEQAASLDLQVNGAGSVTVSQTGTVCTGTCSTTFVAGSQVTLVATPSPDTTFGGWHGGGCTGVSATCTTTVKPGGTIVASNFEPSDWPCTDLVTASESATVFNARLQIPNAVVCLADGVVIDGAVALGADYIHIRAVTRGAHARIRNANGNAVDLGAHDVIRLDGLELEANGTGCSVVVAQGNLGSGNSPPYVTIFESTLRCEGAGCSLVLARNVNMYLQHVTSFAGVGTASDATAMVIDNSNVQFAASTIVSQGALMRGGPGAFGIRDSSVTSLGTSNQGAAFDVSSSMAAAIDSSRVVVAGHSVLKVQYPSSYSRFYFDNSVFRMTAGLPAGSYSPFEVSDPTTEIYSTHPNVFCNEGTSTTDGELALPLVNGVIASTSTFYNAQQVGPSDCTD